MKEQKYSLSIKQSILLLTLLPSLLIAAVLTTYLILSRQSDALNELLFRADSAINYLAKSSELPLFSGDMSTLEQLAYAAISNNDIESVTFYDSNKKELQTIGEKIQVYEINSLNSQYREETKLHWVLQTPVFNSEIEVDDYGEDKETSKDQTIQKYLGWVQIVADKKPLIAKQKTILFAGIGVGSFIFGLLAFIALKLSQSISIPLANLTQTVKDLESGDLDARASVKAYGELKELVIGVNELADKVKISNTKLNIKIMSATQQLTSTLSELEARNLELEVTGNDLANANKVKDEFLASVSHELRTPLTSIIGYADLLKQSHLENEQQSQLDIISQASTTLLQLIDNILDFSKLESDSVELENIAFNLKELLNEVISMHIPAAKSKDINLQLNIDKNVPFNLVGDPLRIKQILNNLIHNAIKFTNKGFVKVSVSTLTSDDFGLLFKITDSGMGIQIGDQSQLFKPFDQLDTSITRRFGGTGLGLAICEKLILNFGGYINVNSEIKKGTEVTFSILNILRQDPNKESFVTETEDKTQTFLGSNSLSEKLIVIAEDNAFVKKLLVKIFEQEGAKVIAKANGLLALEFVKKQKPDLVILDFHMPLLDGPEVCKEIRHLYSSKELPIVLLTADVINVVKKDMKEIGINKVIYKPIKRNELINSVHKLMFNKHQQKSGRVLDLVSDDLLKEELKRLQNGILKTYETKENISLKKYIHDLCGIAGSSAQYDHLWDIAKKLDLKVNNEEYDQLEKLLFDLRNISI